jgi:hypothetical protein
VPLQHVRLVIRQKFYTEKKSLIKKLFADIGLNIASNGSEDSKLEIGDWSQIDSNDGNYKGF